MPSRLPQFLRIPELTRLVFENVSDGRSLVAASITCRHFASVALPILWENRTISLETLYCLLPEPKKLASGDIPLANWERFLHYSQHVRRLRISVCSLHPCSMDPCASSDTICQHLVSLIRLLSGPSRRMDITFKRVQIIEFYPSHYTAKGRLCLLFSPFDPAICSLFSQLPDLRVLQLGSSSHFPQIDLVKFSSDVLQSLVLQYQDRTLVKLLNGFHLPRVHRIRLCQYRPWFKTSEMLQKLVMCCPSLEDITIESSPLSWFDLSILPDFNPFDEPSPLANFDLLRLRFEMQARIILPRSVRRWRTITNHMCRLHTLILNGSDRTPFDEATSVDLDVIVFLVSSLPALEILLVPIIVTNEPLVRISNAMYVHPLHTLGAVFGNPPLAWTQSIVVCLKSIQEFAPEILELEDGEVRHPRDTWSVVRRLFSGLYTDTEGDRCV